MPKDIKNKGAILFGAGLILFILGFVLLYFVNAAASNIFGFLSPFCFVLGIILISLSFTV